MQQYSKREELKNSDFCPLQVLFFFPPHIFLLQDVPTLLMKFGVSTSVESGG